MADTQKKSTARLVSVAAGVAAPGMLSAQRHSFNAVLAALGNFFYTLGFSTEYLLFRLGRMVRDAGLLIGRFLVLLVQWVFRWGKAVLIGIASDLVEPFRRFGRQRRQLARARRLHEKKATEEESGKLFARAQARTLLGFVAGVGGIIMPLGAVVILVFTVSSVINMQYALAVEYNGKVLGYVTDQSVVEGAKGLLRDRIQLAENQEITDWQLNPTYTISTAPAFTTTNQLANEILLSGGEEGDIVPATGFYMDDDLVAVTTDGERLAGYLDEILEGEAAKAPPEAEVGFVREIKCEPDNEDVFFATSVQSYDSLIKKLDGTASGAVRLTAGGEATLSEIAVESNLSLETLLARNPQLEERDGTFVPDEGESLLLQRAIPFLQVQSTIRTSGVEAIPYPVIERENPERAKGVRSTVQRGADGEQQVWDDEIWIAGEFDSRVRQDELTVILAPAVEEIVEIGTRAPRDYLGDLGAPGFIFPVPATTYSTRGYSSGGHRGLDINAPAGVPIYAAESGVVVNAGWHYSFGNYVEIDHGGGIRTLYAHCSALYVAGGEQVAKGTPIGAVGSTGNSSGNHCHLELTINGQLTNPVAYVGYPY